MKERCQDAENEVVTYKCMAHWHHGKWNDSLSQVVGFPSVDQKKLELDLEYKCFVTLSL
jgi:hypothetical protein